jgi:hypothetical protein
VGLQLCLVEYLVETNAWYQQDTRRSTTLRCGSH